MVSTVYITDLETRRVLDAIISGLNKGLSNFGIPGTVGIMDQEIRRVVDSIIKAIKTSDKRYIVSSSVIGDQEVRRVIDSIIKYL